MANQLNQNPVIITAALVPSYKAAVAASQGSLFVLRIERIYWEGPNAIGDQVVIIDPANGFNKIRLVCSVAKQSRDQDWTANPKMWSDFAVPQIDSGNLFIHLR